MPEHRKSDGNRNPNPIKVISPLIRLLLPPHQLPRQSPSLHIIKSDENNKHDQHDHETAEHHTRTYLVNIYIWAVVTLCLEQLSELFLEVAKPTLGDLHFSVIGVD